MVLWKTMEKAIRLEVLIAEPADYKNTCKFYFDVAKDQRLVDLYVNNESYDGYLRDGCVFKEDINIFDKMAASIKYKNGVQVSYSSHHLRSL